jgi:hypothetical protein
MLQEDPAQTHTQHETAHNHTGKARHGYTARTADATHRLDYARAANDVAFDGHRHRFQSSLENSTNRKYSTLCRATKAATAKTSHT